MVDGIFSSAFAAQPLANRGFVVLQMNDELSGTEPTDEAGPANHVLAALTHGKRRYAAATTAAESTP